MAEMPRMPRPDDVGEWLFDEVRRLNSRVIAIVCSDRAAARIWQAVLQETRVPVPGVLVRLVAPIHERLTFHQHMELRPEDMGSEIITVEVSYG